MAESSHDRGASPVTVKDGDGTDAEINRRLTDLIKVNMLKAERKQDLSGMVHPTEKAPAPYGIRLARSFGTGIAELAALGALLILWPLAGLYSALFEKAEQRLR